MSLISILTLGSLPFIAKILTVALGAQGYILQSLYKILQLGIPILWRRKSGYTGRLLVWPFDEPCPIKEIWLLATITAIGLTGTAILAITLFAPLLDISPEVIRTGIDARFAVSAQSAVVVVIFLSFINSAIEELHFRAWLDTELSKRIGNKAGILISALAFGGMHGLIFYGMPSVTPIMILLVIIGLTVAGICWSWLMRIYGGIHAAWWSHGLTDALLLTWGLSWLGYI